ncbi:hypothetical protein, partial [Priestia megaterium]|uniref:hypothetical protein n=1 Tax=Priestia megaterium TaxID=1404 RepID=UPI0034D41811
IIEIPFFSAIASPVNKIPFYSIFSLPPVVSLSFFPFQPLEVVTEKKDSFSLFERSIYPFPFHQREGIYLSFFSLK